CSERRATEGDDAREALAGVPALSDGMALETCVTGEGDAEGSDCHIGCRRGRGFSAGEHEAATHLETEPAGEAFDSSIKRVVIEHQKQRSALADPIEYA